MESGLRSNLSYTWKSVWAAKGLLKLGMRWRVGSGSRISFWNDAWVPRLEDYRLQGNGMGQHYNLVSELLDQHSRQWKEEIITHIMSANEARKVLSIPLSRHLQEDKQAWRAEAFGKYSVRSGGYKLLLKESAEVEPNLQRSTSRQVYKKLWLIELPEKIKITLWRAYKKFIPIYKNLQKIRLRNTVACPRCTHDDESLEHASRDCQGDFEDVKYLLAYVNVVRKLQTVDGLVIYEYLIRFMQNNYLCHLGFWGDRNKQVHERKIRHNIETVRFITMYLKGLEEIKGRLSARCVQKARWRPLEGSFVKINFYASFQGQLLKSCSGLVGRDSAGQIVGMRMILNDYVPSHFAGEAIVCLQGVQMGLDPGFHGVILEGDSLTVVKKLQNKNKDISEINPFYSRCEKSQSGLRRV